MSRPSILLLLTVGLVVAGSRSVTLAQNGLSETIAYQGYLTDS